MAEDEVEVTPQKFLEEFPLYSACTFKSAWSTPRKLSRDCSNCGKETTWVLSGEHTVGECDPYYPRCLAYKCGLCEREVVVFVVYTYGYSTDLRAGPLSARKIGEFPQRMIRISRDLERALGPTTDFYSKALISYSQGYGVGALSYFRRVVEEKTNELIDIVASLAEQRGIRGEDVEKIRLAKNEKTYSDKLQAAALVVPSSLRPGGHNPLAVLHKLLSKGLHALSEEECIEIARDMRQVFEYVFVNLRVQIETDAQFTRGLHRLLDKKESD